MVEKRVHTSKRPEMEQNVRDVTWVALTATVLTNHDSVERRLHPALWESILAGGMSREEIVGSNLHLALSTVAHMEQTKTPMPQ